MRFLTKTYLNVNFKVVNNVVCVSQSLHIDPKIHSGNDPNNSPEQKVKPTFAQYQMSSEMKATNKQGNLKKNLQTLKFFRHIKILNETPFNTVSNYFYSL